MKPLCVLPEVLLLCSLLLPACPLNPSDPNVCSRWESYSVTKQEALLTPHDEPYEEDCDDPRSRFRCTRHKISYRVTYRMGVQTEYRKRAHCCPGYYESRGLCVPCSDLLWGPNCSQRCECRNGGQCDPLTGRCSCTPGYTGLVCEGPCRPGTYGQGCSRQCRCQNGARCDPVTGACDCVNGTTGGLCEHHCPELEGERKCGPPCLCQNGGSCQPGGGPCLCPAGWTGAVCTLPCPRDRFGVNCSQHCHCHNGGECDPITGKCSCAVGYTGVRCQEDCPFGRYGPNCSHTCDCLNQAKCMPDGACLCESGYQGGRCESRLCQDWLFGHQCDRQCACHLTHTQSCHPMSGECSCQPGWSGPQCNQSCPQGTYGAGCLSRCLCLNGGSCLPESGRCLCAPGFTDKHCSALCPAWSYGLNCASRCQCVNAIFCSAIDGSCQCETGWTGPDCSVSCPDGQWGPGCNSTCQCANGARCNRFNGTCTCLPGWQGRLCDQPCPEHRYGQDCSGYCDCEQALWCHPSTGKCHCAPGWTGRRCDWPCALGRWGQNCALWCRCPNGVPHCHPENGTCLCPSGYMGPSCEHSCPPGSWGPDCIHRCACENGGACLPSTGSCQCAQGWTGTDCTQRNGSTGISPAPPADGGSLGAITGIIVLLSVLVILLAAFICFRYKYRGKSNRIPAVTYTPATSISNGEYAVPDVPHSYVHYYANPSYHTLSQYRPSPPPVPQLPNNHDRTSSIKTTNNQLFAKKMNEERDHVGAGHLETNATLPADWKHSPKHKDFGACGMDRSYSYSNSLAKYYNTDYLKSSVGRSSSGSLSSGENPYATIRDLPSLAAKPSESSYVEMASTGIGQDPSYVEIGLVPETDKEEANGVSGGPPQGADRETGQGPRLPPGHYASPKNSHIPVHYDLPPVRHYPPLPRQHR
ncbi:platelet endothelial aggregation receptor 1-like isoform X2 [Hemiscyllium ocellatum]|nr:platelet endothelial aggregation receptor 1-like isoform X2 [Hemiscyllium ocellatum]